MTATLVCSGLRKSFGDRVAVDGVEFSIAAGETYGLLGPNGAGKTTTISMVCGLLTRDAGEILLEGRAFDTTSIDAKASIGLVPQEIAIYPDLSANENLAFFGRLYGLHDPELSERVAEVLETVGLQDRANDRTSEFSGGMKRRLNIGLGLLHRPRLLVLDEPTVGVDPQSRNAILDSVEQLGAGGLSVLYTTHYMEEAERLCDRVGILDEGRLLAEGTRRELVSSIGAHDRVRMIAPGISEPVLVGLRGVAGVVEVSARDAQVDLLVDDAGVPRADRSDRHQRWRHRFLRGGSGARSRGGVPVAHGQGASRLAPMGTPQGRASRTIAEKDLRQRIRDRTALLVGVVLPFALASILALTLGGAAEGDLDLDLGLVDLDGGAVADRFEQTLRAADVGTVHPLAIEMWQYDEPRRAPSTPCSCFRLASRLGPHPVVEDRSR